MRYCHRGIVVATLVAAGAFTFATALTGSRLLAASTPTPAPSPAAFDPWAAGPDRPFETQGPNLFAAGNFQTLPGGWSVDTQDAMPKEAFSVTRGAGKDGGAAAVIHSTSAKGRGRFIADIPVPTGTDIEISVWVKADQALGGISADIDGKAAPKEQAFEIAGGTYGWQRYVFRMTTTGQKGGTAPLKISYLVYGTGTYALCDMQVTAIAPSAAAEAAWASTVARGIAQAAANWRGAKPAHVAALVQAVSGPNAIHRYDELVKAFATAASGSDAWGVLVTDPVEKVFRDRPFRSAFGTAMEIDVARRELQGSQLLLFAYNDDLRQANVSATLANAPKGLQIAVYPVAYGERPKGAAIPWYIGAESKYWPDALVPNRAFTVSAGTVQPVYLRVSCAAGVPAGDYTGQVTVKTSAGESRVPLHIRVRLAELPVALHLRTMMGSLKQTQPYIDLALEQHMGLGGIYAGMSWTSPSVPSLPRKGDSYDFSQLEPKLQHAIDHGLNVIVVGLTPKSGKFGFPKTYSAEWKAQMQSVVKAYSRFLKSKHWFDRAYFINIDEPWSDRREQVKMIYDTIKKAQPDINIISCLNDPGDAEALKDHADTFDLYIQQFGQQQGLARQRAGKEIWWAACVWPSGHPNLFIEYPLLDARIIGWMAYKYHIDGFEYWNMTFWGADLAAIPGGPADNGAWIKNNDGTLVTRWIYNKPAHNGDGYLTYPGAHGQPINSLRFEALRDGLEENQLLMQLQSNLAHLTVPERLKAQALLNGDGVVANEHVYTANPAKLVEARRELLDLLDNAIRNGGTSDGKTAK